MEQSLPPNFLQGDAKLFTPFEPFILFCHNHKLQCISQRFHDRSEIEKRNRVFVTVLLVAPFWELNIKVFSHFKGSLGVNSL